jgi:hypothetical protein
MQLRTLAVPSLCALGLSVPAVAQHAGHAGHWGGADGAWHEHDGWHGDMRHFDHGRWRGGHWWNGNYGGRVGWWWIIGPDWYWYPAPIYPYPDPFVPPDAAAGSWYWCDVYQQYYPYVGNCPSGWRAVPPQREADKRELPHRNAVSGAL